jgi:hypothetical protein
MGLHGLLERWLLPTFDAIQGLHTDQSVTPLTNALLPAVPQLPEYCYNGYANVHTAAEDHRTCTRSSDTANHPIITQGWGLKPCCLAAVINFPTPFPVPYTAIIHFRHTQM